MEKKGRGFKAEQGMCARQGVVKEDAGWAWEDHTHGSMVTWQGSTGGVRGPGDGQDPDGEGPFVYSSFEPFFGT